MKVFPKKIFLFPDLGFLLNPSRQIIPLVPKFATTSLSAPSRSRHLPPENVLVEVIHKVIHTLFRSGDDRIRNTLGAHSLTVEGLTVEGQVILDRWRDR